MRMVKVPALALGLYGFSFLVDSIRYGVQEKWWMCAGAAFVSIVLLLIATEKESA